MQKLILRQPENYKSYLIEKCEGDTIYLLAYFLVETWLERIHEYTEWAYDPNEWFMGMNVAKLEKEDNYILMGSDLSDQEDGGPFFKISIDEFVKLLPQWKKLVDEGAQEITIIETDDKKILISGK